MLAVAALLTLGTGIAFGVLPALRVCRKADGSALKEGARGGTSRGTERLRSAFVVAEIVASVVLLVVGGPADPGADEGAVDRSRLPQRERADAEDDAAAAEVPTRRVASSSIAQVIGETHALPGVESAAYISFTPFTMRGGMWEVLTTTPDPTSLGGLRRAARRAAGASLRYRHAGLLRDDRHSDPAGPRRQRDTTRSTRRVAVVSESFARQHFPDQDPIGRQFGFACAVRTIVGVVGDIRFRGLERNDSEPQVYLAASQQRDA